MKIAPRSARRPADTLPRSFRTGPSVVAAAAMFTCGVVGCSDAGCPPAGAPVVRGSGSAAQPPAAVEPADPAPVRVASASSAPAAGPAPSAADDLTARLAGTWHRYEYGDRTLEVSPDGTAVMTVTPAGMYSYLVGDRVTVRIRWELEGDDTVHFESVSGEPAAAFKTVSTMFGTERTWRIDSVDAERMVFVDPEDGERQEWDAVEEERIAGAAE